MNKKQTQTYRTMPELKKIVAKDFPEFKVVRKNISKKPYSAAPADKTRTSR